MPGRVPFQPITSSTTTGLTFAGVVGADIPPYDDLAVDNVPEWTIGALTQSCEHAELEERKRRDKNEEPTGQDINTNEQLHYKRPTSNRLTPLLLGSFRTGPPYSTNQSLGLSLGSHLADNFPLQTSQALSRPFQDQYDQVDAIRGLNTHKITSTSPHQTPSDHGRPAQVEVLQSAPNISGIDLVVAVPPSSKLRIPHHNPQVSGFSAPGSRFVSVSNTPHDSRSATPINGLQVPSTLRLVASSSRLQQLRIEEGVNAAFNANQMKGKGRNSRQAEHLIGHDIIDTDIVRKIEDAKLSNAAREMKYWKDLDFDPMNFFNRSTEETRKCRVATDSAHDEQLASKTEKLYGDPGDIRLFTGDLLSPTAHLPPRMHYENSSVGGSSENVSRYMLQDPEITARVSGLGHVRTQSQRSNICTLPAVAEQTNSSPSTRPRNTVDVMSGGENAILGLSYMASASLGHVNGSTTPAPPVDSINKTDEIIFGRPTPATPMATDTDKIRIQESPGHRSPKCAIHGEGCDGKTTIHKRRSETAGETGGFLE